MEMKKSADWLSSFKEGEKVLLVNPSVQEVRYAWVKWNQPSDLLLLSSKLKSEQNCEVELLDLMLPNESGRVPLRDLGHMKRIRRRGEPPFEYKSRTYGHPLLEAKRTFNEVFQEWKPDHIVITTLTSYWFSTLTELIAFLRTILPGVKVSLMGAYPTLETSHASRARADVLVTDFIRFGNYTPDFGLYFQDRTRMLNGGRTIAFGGLKYTETDVANHLIQQVRVLKELNIREGVIFEGNLFRDQCSVLSEFLERMDKEDIRINLHGLCGLEIADAVGGIYHQMSKGGFRSFFLEHTLDSDSKQLNLDAYGRAYDELRKNPVRRLQSGDLAGFIMIGKPDDDLHRLFTQCFNLLELCGSIIPKPYTPDPFGERELYEQITSEGLEYLSPHVFPLAERNGITREQYLDLYKHTTFLNEKRMGNSFDFFDNRYSSVALKRSLGKKGGTV
ncbi:hypothetical protein [Tumebacillus permanentifrigoris]|uniref:Uncharacterized protein n=1 Tax=Tumebacillus permanentifrigoris TaxID=378543 RepID=A0A316DA21_9BACL|nr:hypothetical protein [Tumebacillus permanentifrigoris]PWK13473.1 hypothetical protein C7459_107141 [Tumebacillus permanentifrigoris]